MKNNFWILWYEISLGVKEKLRYKISMLSDFIIFLATYIGIYFLNIDVNFATYYNLDISSSRMLVFVGYIFWQMSSCALGYSSSGIRSDAMKGMLELKLQSKFPIFLMNFIELIINLVFNLVPLIGIIIFTILTSSVSLLEFKIFLISLIVCIPSIIGMYGMGLILGGITLIEKSIGQFVFILQALLLIGSNAMSPTRSFLVSVFPFSMGIDITRNIYLNIPVGIERIIIYIVINIIWIFIGALFFNYLLKRQRKNGSFDYY
ncbi:MAG: hypothetical protein ACERKV_01655 [Clostridiaceae bacterium]